MRPKILGLGFVPTPPLNKVSIAQTNPLLSQSWIEFLVVYYHVWDLFFTEKERKSYYMWTAQLDLSITPHCGNNNWLSFCLFAFFFSYFPLNIFIF